MRILITTQKVDKDDDVLGFFHNWIIKLAPHFSEVHVIALSVGKHDLPKNVHVYSLGKRRGDSGYLKTLRYIVRFYKYLFMLSGKYDAVFSHMNPEYIILAGWYWRLSDKKVFLWYNHKKGGLRLRFASLFSHKIFYTSPSAFTSRYKKSEKMPVGVDTELCKDIEVKREKNSLLSLGRISPVKNVEVIIEALSLLNKEGISFTSYIYGDPTDKDLSYYKEVLQGSENLTEEGALTFNKGVPYEKTPRIYSAYEIFINATPSGSFDKTILEAINCGMIPVICNEAFGKDFPKELLFTEGDSKDLKNKLEKLFNKNAEEKKELQKYLREHILKEHSLDDLILLLSDEIRS
ncbi:hypothetical protein CL631_02705 [bacterium]|jgi:glycosyltransferase involved in cell wall biosynthesis|nr:hypothetical protein [bacterium]MDP6659891.1 glycosyltransferase family 4 protein [Candidatus Paceibacterota bacterium]|tara:strand:- start:46041 stop:47087 length:1047 start_codon:yes stop_codon:yes gene_type:complete